MKKVLFLLVFSISAYSQLTLPFTNIAGQKKFITPTAIGLGSVNNTSDANKPVSTATQTALNLKANIASPIFTGNIGIGATATAPLTIQGTVDTGTLGSELLDNNSFTSNLSSWTVGANWSWSAGGALHTTGSTETLSENINVVSGNTYILGITTSGRTTGSITFQLGSLNYVYDQSISGTYNDTEYKSFVATSTGSVTFTITPTTDFNGSVTNVSIKLLTIGSVLPSSNVLSSTGVLSNETRVNGTLENVFIGLGSGRSNSNGYKNVSLGHLSLYSTTTGYQNTSIGHESQEFLTTGYSNVSVGAYSQNQNFAGSRNVSIGVYALKSITTARFNTAIGTHAGEYISTGDFNIAIGGSALGLGVTTGSHNIAIGGSSGAVITSGQYNVMQGFQAGRLTTTGSNNVFIGLQAGYNNVSSIGITAVGSESLLNNTSSSNSAFGSSSGKSITTGSSNTFVGASAGFNGSQKVDAINSMALGALTFTTADNQVVLGNSSVTTTTLRGAIAAGTSISTGAATLAGDVTIGASTEKISARSMSLAFNRNAQSGAIYDTNGFGYQIQHTQNTINTSDWLAFQVYNTAGGAVANNALVINGAGNTGLGTTSQADRLAVNGSVNLITAGNKIKIATGSNASVGTATLVGGTVTVSTTAAATGSLIFITRTANGGTIGHLSVGTITNGTSFVINSNSGSETSTVNWWIIN